MIKPKVIVYFDQICYLCDLYNNYLSFSVIYIYSHRKQDKKIWNN